MDKVFIYNELLGAKGTPGMLHEASSKGYYVAVMKFKEKKHRVLLPINSTTIIYSEPVVEIEARLDIE